MLNYRSVTSSEPQIRSNPALKSCPYAFQKNAQTLLEGIQPVFPTYSRIQAKHESVLSKHAFYVWKRPAHLRSQWILLDPSLPTLLIDPKTQKANCLRIPSRPLALQKLGTILCEGSWDAQEHILWIWDVLYWNRQNVWQTESYRKRWEHVKELVTDVLDFGNPMSDAELRVPTFESLREIRGQASIDSSFAIEFQPDKEGQRRLCFFETRSRPQQRSQQGLPQKPRQHPVVSEKRVQEPVKQTPSVRVQIDDEPVKTPMEQPVETPVETTSVNEKKQIGKEKRLQSVSIVKDATSRLPDTYRVLHSGVDMGLLAIRGMEMSRKLRDMFAKRESCTADVEWYEPFQKYELKQLYFS